MDRNKFWTLVDSASGSDDRAAKLRSYLDELSLEEIASFQEHFDDLVQSSFAWPLWGAAYLIDGGCSDDGFTDFRYGLISRGRKIFESAVADPDSLADFEIQPYELADELYGYVAIEVYEEKSGDEIPRKDFPYGEPTGDEWDFDNDEESKLRLPKIYTKYCDSSH